RLPATTDAGQRDEAMRSQQVAHVRSFLLTTDEARSLRRKRRADGSGAQRWKFVRKSGHAELEHLLRTVEVAKPLGAEIGERNAGRERVHNKLLRRLRHDGL